MATLHPGVWHRRGEKIREIKKRMKLDDEGRRIIRETAHDCDLLARRAREKNQAREAIDRLLETPFTHKRSKQSPASARHRARREVNAH